MSAVHRPARTATERTLRHLPASSSRILLALVASLALACGSQVPSATPSPTASPPAPWWPAESPAPAVWIPALEPATIDEPLPHVFGGSMATAVVEFQGSLLAFGGVNGGCCDASFSTDTHAVIWGSVDGRSWRLHPRGQEFALGTMTAATASSDRIVAVGTRRMPEREPGAGADAQGAVWTSEDGETWELVTNVPVFTTVVATTSGFIAASNTHAFPELWGSETGSTWRPIAGLPELGDGRIDRLLATPSGFIGVGSSLNWVAEGQPEIEDPPAAVWRSTDGETWARVPTTAMFEGASIRDVAWSDGRLLAVGSGGSLPRSAFWTSTNGDAWDRIEAPGVAEVPGASMMSWRAARVIGVPHGFAVAGTWDAQLDDASQSGLGIWTTQDGLDWQHLSLAGEQLEIRDWVLTQTGGIAVAGWGWSKDVERMVPLAWTIATPP